MQGKICKWVFCFLVLISCDGNLNYYNRSRFGGNYYRKNRFSSNNVYSYTTEQPNSSKYSKFGQLSHPQNNDIAYKSEKMSSNTAYDRCNGGYYKIGNPYNIFGKTYYPREYSKLVEYGLASWYGDDFHRKKTANGEVFNMNDMTGAHKTLPLPSIVKVTNLENGKSVIIRVNDRGPFVDNRIIDLSKMAAHELDFKQNGLTNVKVELLVKETDKHLKRCGLVVD